MRACSTPVLSGSIVGWGREAEGYFAVIVFLYLDTAIRLERLRNREVARFGHVSSELLQWASEYDTVEGLAKPPLRGSLRLRR
jgi:hypothetical protein